MKLQFFLQNIIIFFRLKQYADFGEKIKSGKFTNVDFDQMVEFPKIDIFFTL